MADDLVTLDEALAAAHLPALVAAMVHMTGDAGWLRPEWTPTYTPLARNDPGISESEQAKIREAAKAAITAYLAGEPMKLATPDQPLLRRMMDYVGGAPIPERYADFLIDELALSGSSKDPHFEQPRLKEAARKLKVLVIGAGMSGLLTGIRLSQAGIPFEIVESNPDVGGTWLVNTYPGCRVDNANHMYSYSFEPNHAWPQHFSPQPELLKYFRGVADKHDLKKHIRFETTVESLTWDEDRAVWRAQLIGKDGGRETVEANAVVTAVGQLNRPRLPDIEGRDSFQGPAFHSAQWRHDVDLTGKRVAVIGTGASAFQFVPEIAPKVAQLKVFQRTPPWGLPVPHYHEDVPEGMKWLLEHVPYYDKWYRFWLFWMTTEGFLPMVKSDPDWTGPTTAVGEANAALREMAASALAAQVQDRPDLLPHVVPTYPVGGKRAVLDNGVWLGALKRPNVELVTERITRITPTGVVTADGVEHEVDVILYGTGFQASRFLSGLSVKGRGGRDLHEAWAGDARAYLGMTTPGFPNFFIIYGPNTNIVVNGSIIFFSECAVRYIVGALKLMAETGARAMEVKRDVHDAFNIRVDEANKGWAWGSPNVTSWYKNEFGRVSQNWPFGLIDYWRATLAPNPDDFVLEKQAEPVA
ncbi:NAD(P)/FAD-dependent oxidoreductase [Phenylobacterium hankyongense]|uniref:NAD(P)/FAD-dependent oxidoreductase n=1 Tax=Phenylobacterium hankyongense TaxID=1813876 RepID=A0A328B7W8_9CAUL|nr:NAD(P)/FAD-dependent oxidoreductase [Phenylobacterium hankyongense]RAK61068.1 NAD(P)/FAD-dependent oxidoreductase [Phenylobacterium hankyongense]